MYSRLKNEDLLKELNDLTVEIENQKYFMLSDEFFHLSTDDKMNHFLKIEENTELREKLNDKINDIMSYAPTLTDKLYLAEIIEKEKPEFKSNNLIISPTGSGKTTLIKEYLIENKRHTVLMLVSNETLKSQLAPIDNETRKKLSNRMFTSQNKEVYGDKLYRIHVMTYAEFGERIYVNDKFWRNVTQVFCDEIHSLPEYIKYGAKTNGGLIHSQRLLFNKHENKTIYYFTATDKNLIEMESERPGTMDCVTVFDYRNYENIMKFVPRATRKITDIEQIRQYLKDRNEGFKYYKYKGIAFSKRIKSLKTISDMVIEEGFNPLVLWSENNDDYLLTDEQKKAKVELLTNNKIPEPYDFLIYNSAYQEGWDLKDNSVKLAIMNTTNETEHIQALGRLRRDVDLLIYRTNELDVSQEVEINPKYINKSLTNDLKKKLCKELNLLNSKGNILQWRGVKSLIIKSGYNVEDTTERKDGKVVRVSIITEN